MAKRARIVIPFNYDEGWTGGNYYISNLVASLSCLPCAIQPDILILSHNQKSYKFIADTSNYKRIRWISSLSIEGIDGGLSLRLKFLANIVPSFFKKKIDFDVIFPFPIDTKERDRTICWIPDLQDKELPQLFSPEELNYRTKQHLYYINNFNHILFSSRAARADFEKHYPQSKNIKHVMPFAVNMVDTAHIPDNTIKKFSLPDDFFYCPNQFWAHKNHKTVIDAVHLLAQKGIKITVAFSGKEMDRRVPDYVNNIKKLVCELKMEQQIRFLGFISKGEQYALIDSAISLLQPSLFEGWSTVIEEAKSRSQFVIASDIPVHREQLDINADFFDPYNSESLAKALQKRLHNPISPVKIDYDSDRRKFAMTFLDIVKKVIEGN